MVSPVGQLPCLGQVTTWMNDEPVSGEVSESLRGLHGWRQNISLLLAVLFPHLVRA